MSISGNIRTFPLTDLLQWFSISRRTGILSVIASQVTTNLFIRAGILVTAVSSEASRRIGQFLIARGFIDEPQLRQALDDQRENPTERRLGQILCAEGQLAEEALRAALHQRTEEIVYDLFLLEEGVFHFNPNLFFPDGSLEVELNLSLDQLVMEGIRRSDEWARIREVLPHPAVRVQSAGRSTPPPPEAGEVGPHLLSLLTDGPQAIGSLVMATRRSPFEVHESLHLLACRGWITVDPNTLPIPDPTEAPNDVARLEAEIRDLAARRAFQSARERLAGLRRDSLDGDRLHVLEQWLAGEELSHLRSGLPETGVPLLTVDLAKTRDAGLNPQEGFLLTRLGEGMTVRSLCQVMPLTELHILRILNSLQEKGLIRLSTPS